MATSKSKSCFAKGCTTKITSTCVRCPHVFYCHKHHLQHREDLKQQLENLIIERDGLKHKIEEQKTEPQQHALMKKIDEWERDSIVEIQQMAKETKQILLYEFAKFFLQVANPIELFNKLTSSKA